MCNARLGPVLLVSVPVATIFKTVKWEAAIKYCDFDLNVDIEYDICHVVANVADLGI